MEGMTEGRRERLENKWKEIYGVWEKLTIKDGLIKGRRERC